eukprot:765281-Hanusia_phi.AAC.7
MEKFVDVPMIREEGGRGGGREEESSHHQQDMQALERARPALPYTQYIADSRMGTKVFHHSDQRAGERITQIDKEMQEIAGFGSTSRPNAESSKAISWSPEANGQEFLCNPEGEPTDGPLLIATKGFDTPPTSSKGSAKRLSKTRSLRSSSRGRSVSPHWDSKPRVHRSDPQGFSYANSYNLQKQENEVLVARLKKAFGLLQELRSYNFHLSSEIRNLEHSMAEQTSVIEKRDRRIFDLEEREAKLSERIDKLSRNGELMLKEMENDKMKCACLEKEISWMTEHHQNRQKELEEQAAAANRQRREEAAQATAEKADLMKSIHGYEARMSKLENEILVYKETIARKDVEISQQVKILQAERKQNEQEMEELKRKLQRQVEETLDLSVQYDELESKSKKEIDSLSTELREERQLALMEAGRGAEDFQKELAELRSLLLAERKESVKLQEEYQAIISKQNEEISNLKHSLDIRESTVKARDAEIGRCVEETRILEGLTPGTHRAAAEQDQKSVGGHVVGAKGNQ